MKPPAGIGPALAHPDAAVHRRGEVAAVLGEREATPPGQRRGTGPAQVRVHRPGPHQHPRIQQIRRIQQLLEITERQYRRLGVHQWQQLAAGTAIAVFPGQ